MSSIAVRYPNLVAKVVALGKRYDRPAPDVLRLVLEAGFREVERVGSLVPGLCSDRVGNLVRLFPADEPVPR